MRVGIEHVAISVGDIERSIEFYQGVLGLRLVRRIDSTPERRLGEIVGLPGASALIAHLGSADGGGFMLELFQYRNPAGRPLAQERTQADIGISHICFSSSDARADYAHLQEFGVECIGPPVEFRPGVWLFYFRGPDGEVCELREA